MLYADADGHKKGLAGRLREGFCALFRTAEQLESRHQRMLVALSVAGEHNDLVAEKSVFGQQVGAGACEVGE